MRQVAGWSVLMPQLIDRFRSYRSSLRWRQVPDQRNGRARREGASGRGKGTSGQSSVRCFPPRVGVGTSPRAWMHVPDRLKRRKARGARGLESAPPDPRPPRVRPVIRAHVPSAGGGRGRTAEASGAGPKAMKATTVPVCGRVPRADGNALVSARKLSDLVRRPAWRMPPMLRPIATGSCEASPR